MYKKNLVNQFEVSVIFLEFSEAYNSTKGYNSPTASNYMPLTTNTRYEIPF